MPHCSLKKNSRYVRPAEKERRRPVELPPQVPTIEHFGEFGEKGPVRKVANSEKVTKWRWGNSNPRPVHCECEKESTDK